MLGLQGVLDFGEQEGRRHRCEKAEVVSDVGEQQGDCVVVLKVHFDVETGIDGLRVGSHMIH